MKWEGRCVQYSTMVAIFHFVCFRRHLGQLVYSQITSGRVPAGLVSPLLSEQAAIWPQESFRIEKLLEIIADIRYPGLSESCVSSETSLSNLSYLDLKVLLCHLFFMCTCY